MLEPGNEVLEYTHAHPHKHTLYQDQHLKHVMGNFFGISFRYIIQKGDIATSHCVSASNSDVVSSATTLEVLKCDLWMDFNIPKYGFVK